MQESEIEKQLGKAVKNRGGLCIKLTSAGKRKAV